jgi:UV DNA damage endonuclease
MIYPGYCCINLTLQKTLGVTTNRTMRRDTFLTKGIDYVSDLVLQNVSDLIHIIDWNGEKNIQNFRMSSEMFPWASEYVFEDLKDWKKISSKLKEAGELSLFHGMRISFHPGPFVKLGSKREEVVINSIKDLEIHNRILDEMSLEANTFYPINIHVGMSYDPETSERFCNSFNKLSPNLQKRLVVENDDKRSSYSVSDLYTDIHSKIGIPITFDYFHHEIYPGDDVLLTEEQAFALAHSTWEEIPLFHYSESKALHEGVECNETAHSDYINTLPDDYGKDIFLDIEAKAKELSLLRVLKETKYDII